MKLNTLFALLLAVLPFIATAQDTFLQIDGGLRIDHHVPEGKTALLISVFSSFTNDAWIQFQRPGSNNVTRFYFDKQPAFSTHITPIPSDQVNIQRPLIFNGPGWITAGDSGAFFGLVIADTEQKDSGSTASGIPSTAVVIPSDAEGIVDIILESSTDLINWNPANPGSYNADQNNRFFRVRAVKK